MGGQVEIVVSDDGVGMTAEKLASIREGDTGRMGMQNIFNKIHLIEGARVDFISHPGQGTTIRIYLPGGKEDDLESHNR
jgi:sensor histidine kinase YesM